MSDLPDADEWEQRRRWGYAVLAAVALTTVAALWFVLGTPEKDRTLAPTAARGPGLVLSMVPSSPASAAATTSHRSPTRAHRSSHLPAVPATPASSAVARFRCPGASPCVVPGFGAADAALEQYRRGRGLGDVDVRSTPQAQLCAISGASGVHCGALVARALEADQDGRRAVADMVASDSTALADPGLGAVQLAWALDPVTGHYLCVVLRA